MECTWWIDVGVRLLAITALSGCLNIVCRFVF
jgi:hypothetical protein